MKRTVHENKWSIGLTEKQAFRFPNQVIEWIQEQQLWIIMKLRKSWRSNQKALIKAKITLENNNYFWRCVECRWKETSYVVCQDFKKNLFRTLLKGPKMAFEIHLHFLRNSIFIFFAVMFNDKVSWGGTLEHFTWKFICKIWALIFFYPSCCCVWLTSIKKRSFCTKLDTFLTKYVALTGICSVVKHIKSPRD